MIMKGFQPLDMAVCIELRIIQRQEVAPEPRQCPKCWFQCTGPADSGSDGVLRVPADDKLPSRCRTARVPIDRPGLCEVDNELLPPKLPYMFHVPEPNVSSIDRNVAVITRGHCAFVTGSACQSIPSG